MSEKSRERRSTRLLNCRHLVFSRSSHQLVWQKEAMPEIQPYGLIPKYDRMYDRAKEVIGQFLLFLLALFVTTLVSFRIADLLRLILGL